MNPEIFLERFDKAFQRYGNKSAVPAVPNFELDVYNKLLNLFQIGDSYYFIIDHRTLSLEMVSKELENVLGYQTSEFDISFMISKIHPDDHSWFLGIGEEIAIFFSSLPVHKRMQYKVQYDVRYLKKTGDYVRMLYQGILLEQNEQGRFLKTLGVHTDISHLKREGRPILSFIGMEGEPSFIDVSFKNVYVERKEDLTARERQVLKLLIEGRMSKEIGAILKISKQTVDTHRKNMLHKKHLGNTGELIGRAIREGWV
ncbi:MAG: helix-turn-helix transcriptional regulator [Chitinophagaceae bacterium]|nr:helix-turn-helix transcriptional regulator [Chitinophagaceae bacterium]